MPGIRDGRSIPAPRCDYCGAIRSDVARPQHHEAALAEGGYCHGGFWCKTPEEWAEWERQNEAWRRECEAASP